MTVQADSTDALLRDVELEATAAAAAAPRLTDKMVGLRCWRGRVARRFDGRGSRRERRDVAAARGSLDAARSIASTLDEGRVAGLVEQLHTLAELPPLEREIESGRSRTV